MSPQAWFTVLALTLTAALVLVTGGEPAAVGDMAPAPALATSPGAAPARVADEPAAVRVVVDPVGAAPGEADATASLVGRLCDDSGRGLVGELACTLGAGLGATGASGGDGGFAIAGLYPGFCRWRVRTPLGTCERELSLRPGVPTRLDLTFGRGVVIGGSVRDGRGAPVDGAVVEFDGVTTVTGSDGSFAGRAAAAGPVSLLVRAAGFAASWQALPADDLDLRVVLLPGCRLRLAAHGPGTADVYLLPASTGPRAVGGGSQFPWHLVSPRRLPAGAEVLLDGLPAMAIAVHTVPAGGASTVRRVWMQDGRERSLALTWLAAPRPSGERGWLRAAVAALGPAAVRCVGQPILPHPAMPGSTMER